MKTDFKFSGFINDAAYTAYANEFLKSHADDFPGVQELNLIVKEIPYTMLGHPQPAQINYNEDGTVLTISTTTNKYYDRKGKITSIPDSMSFYDGLKHLLKHASDEHGKR